MPLDACWGGGGVVVVLERLDFPRSQTDVAPSCEEKREKNKNKNTFQRSVSKHNKCAAVEILSVRQESRRAGKPRSEHQTPPAPPHPGKTSPVLQQRVN